jgi:hypothetical protein
LKHVPTAAFKVNSAQLDIIVIILIDHQPSLLVSLGWIGGEGYFGDDGPPMSGVGVEAGTGGEVV